MTAVKIKDLGGATMNAIDVGGFITPDLTKSPTETKRIFDNVPNFKFRQDDLMLCTYPKTGTNWIFEILMMILNKSSKTIEAIKDNTMLEFQSAEEVHEQASPRTINCNYPYRYLPWKDMKAKQIKTVLCLRNPKDTLVSYYNFMVGVKTYGYDGKWSDWLPVYMQGKLEYGKYSDYLHEWENAIKEGVGYPLHIMYYEDMKLHGLEELNKLLKFLDVEIEEELKNDILQNCSFENMASAKQFPKEIADAFFKEGYNFFRKGQVGDWENWFTVAQNEMFDETWETEMNGSSFSKFAYTDPRH